MATIYRFIVENRQTESRSSGRKSDSESSGGKKRGAAKKGRYVSILGGEKGGVEHNRKLRAINPLLNKATGGYWERGMRLGRAGAGLITKNTETNKIGISGPAIAIIIAMIITSLLRYRRKAMDIANKNNENNFKAMENGYGTVHESYTVSKTFWSGTITYNQNK